ncbi:hypothetical protein CARN8_1660003 [mine drainage metagenome]|uniref:Uncharacterized protein n=1 Tax=mine drainage metagenome TaxID=410659 RepID=A0A3P3ZM20_9ZZZZ
MSSIYTEFSSGYDRDVQKRYKDAAKPVIALLRQLHRARNDIDRYGHAGLEERVKKAQKARKKAIDFLVANPAIHPLSQTVTDPKPPHGYP